MRRESDIRAAYDTSLGRSQTNLPNLTYLVGFLAPVVLWSRPHLIFQSLKCFSLLMERGYLSQRYRSLNKGGLKMRKLRLVLAVSALTISALVALSAQAVPHMTLPFQNHSEVQQVGCTSAGPRCPLGRAWVCPPRSVCYCAPCGRYYGAPWRYPLRPWRWHY